MKSLLLSCICFLGTHLLNSQDLWLKVDFEDLKASPGTQVSRENVKYYHLDIIALRDLLFNFEKEAKTQEIRLAIPLPDGNLEEFVIRPSRTMAVGLQKKFPEIRSYTGRSQGNLRLLRATIGPKGFRGSIFEPEGIIQIEPAESGESLYKLHTESNDHVNSMINTLTCGVSGSHEDIASHSMHYKSLSSQPVKLRTYRLALACTGEWGAWRGNTVEEVLSDMVTSVNLINQVFERDLAIRFELIAENDTLIHLDGATDPYPSPSDGFSLLAENTSVINNLVTFNAYDVGHVFTRNCSDVGGVANISSICSGSKGAGVSCHSGNSLSNFALSIAVHEMGHQLGASHSFNNCGGNENFGTAYEPGSGSTIMSYAGLCGSNNVQASNDRYFHSISMQQIFGFTRTDIGNTCPSILESPNTTPVPEHDYANGFTIPIGTPFELEGTAFDAEEDPLSYTWEQFNLGSKSSLGMPMDNAPSFRAVSPQSASTRVFPSLNKILNNAYDITEVLPTTSRDFDFRFVVRDNNPDAGGVDWVEVRFASTAEAGPFLIQYPNEKLSWNIGEEVDLLWDVAGTDSSVVDCQFVEILFSTDGGQNFPIIIRANTPNDGAETIIVPYLPTDQGRFKIKSRGNIFFDVSDVNISIEEPSVPGYFIQPEPPETFVCAPGVIEIPIFTRSFQGYDEMLMFEITGGLPGGASAEFTEPTTTLEDTAYMILDLNQVATSELHELQLRSISTAGDTLYRTIEVNIVSSFFDSLELELPVNGSSGIGIFPSFSWSPSLNAELYEFELSHSPSFDESTFLYHELLNSQSFIPDTPLEINELYFWRVRSTNACDASDYSDISTFHTETLDCQTYSSENTPINISASGVRTVEAPINIADAGEVQEINVIKIKGTHEQVSDLKISLVSPSGTAAVLFNRLCGNLANFDMGFDDESSVELTCPVTGGTSFQPTDSLSIFRGEEASGEWILRIDDESPGFGGALTEFTFEICTNISVNPPFLSVNEPLQTPPGIVSRIKEDLLLTEDDNTPAEALLYTLVSLPESGILTLDDIALKTGDQFTQNQINQHIFRYTHDGSETTTDEFTFVVEDGEGGWIDITSFQIVIDSDFTSSTSSPDFDAEVRIFPSPASEFLKIEFSSPLKSDGVLGIYDFSGRLMDQLAIYAHDKSIEQDISRIPSGIYLLHIQSGSEYMNRKMVILR